MDIKQHRNEKLCHACESRGGRPGLHDPNKLFISMVSVDVKQHRSEKLCRVCESRSGSPGLPVPNKPYGFCGRKTTEKRKTVSFAC